MTRDEKYSELSNKINGECGIKNELVPVNYAYNYVIKTEALEFVYVDCEDFLEKLQAECMQEMYDELLKHTVCGDRETLSREDFNEITFDISVKYETLTKEGDNEI